MTQALVFAGLWREFGISGDRAMDADATWLRRLDVLELVRAGGGEDEWPTT